MVYNIIYSLFKNNYDAFTNLSYVTYFIKSIVFLHVLILHLCSYLII